MELICELLSGASHIREPWPVGTVVGGRAEGLRLCAIPLLHHLTEMLKGRIVENFGMFEKIGYIHYYVK